MRLSVEEMRAEWQRETAKGNFTLLTDLMFGENDYVALEIAKADFEEWFEKELDEKDDVKSSDLIRWVVDQELPKVVERVLLYRIDGIAENLTKIFALRNIKKMLAGKKN